MWKVTQTTWNHKLNMPNKIPSLKTLWSYSMSCGQNVPLMYRLCSCKTRGHILCIWLQADNGVTSLNVLMKLSGLFSCRFQQICFWEWRDVGPHQPKTLTATFNTTLSGTGLWHNQFSQHFLMQPFIFNMFVTWAFFFNQAFNLSDLKTNFVH